MYAIDRIEKNLVIAENLKTKEKIEIKKEEFSFEPREGLIFSIENEKIIEKKEVEEDRRKLLREKMERLKHHE